MILAPEKRNAAIVEARIPAAANPG